LTGTVYKPMSDWNITIIKEGRLFEHKQTGKVVFVPKQTDATIVMKGIRVAIKSLIRELICKKQAL